MESKIFYEYQHPVEAAIDAEKENYPSALTDGDVFEIFCSDNILKNFDLSFDQVSKGIVDGPHDGALTVHMFLLISSLSRRTLTFRHSKVPSTSK